jgi:peptidoglycan/xylan/chitin deacetylase (PgdA/CDA1 family)
MNVLMLVLAALNSAPFEPIPDKTVVLTFDDAVKSHVTFVAPMLKQYGFGATFFVTQAWMSDTQNFLTWENAAEIHRMGFEIGNHSWTHAGFNTEESAEKLRVELKQVEESLAVVGVPKPTTFAWCGNAFGPESLQVLRESGYVFARRGMQPEQPYGQIHIGPTLSPGVFNPLLIPTTADAYPCWTLEHFKKVVALAKDGKIVVLQFHGSPDIAHPWVHTPPERLWEYAAYLKDNGFNCIALRDLAKFIDPVVVPDDPVAKERYPKPKQEQSK